MGSHLQLLPAFGCAIYSKPCYIHIIWNILKILIILEFKVVNHGKFWKYIHSTHNLKSEHNFLQIARQRLVITVYRIQ
jgi:hypothetical protein